MFLLSRNREVVQTEWTIVYHVLQRVWNIFASCWSTSSQPDTAVVCQCLCLQSQIRKPERSTPWIFFGPGWKQTRSLHRGFFPGSLPRQGWRGLGSSWWPLLADPGMVPGSSGSHPRRASSAVSGASRPSSAAVRRTTRKPLSPPPSLLAAVRRRLLTLGSSKDTMKLIGEAHRSSISTVYDSHWR